MTDLNQEALERASNATGRIVGPATSEIIIRTYLASLPPVDAEPVAWWVHDFHIARQPVKAQGKFPEPTEYLYPASRENDAKATARTLGGECEPLYPAAAIIALQGERDAARQALERDRSVVITAVHEFSDAFARRSWLLESRGSYEWDDNRYRDEFKAAYVELSAPIEKLKKIGHDWSNCPTDHDEIMRSRIDWQSRAEAAEAEVDRITYNRDMFASRCADYAAEVVRLKDELVEAEKKLNACNWYWPEDDTSSEACSESAQEVVQNICDWNGDEGDVIAVARGGIVEVTYCASLPPADDSDSDDDFWAEEATYEAAKAKIDAERDRRARSFRDEQKTGDEDDHHCPICAEPFEPADLCASDIELGICHAACLHGSPTVNLDTGEPVDGPIPTYRYDGQKTGEKG